MFSSQQAWQLPANIAKCFIKADIEFVRSYLFHHKNDPHALNAVDKYGNTPLILAAREGHGRIVKLLLANPCVNVNATNKNGDSALMAAALMAYPHIAKLLLRHKNIDVNIQDKSGDTALHTAIAMEDPEFVARLLHHKTTNVNLQNDRGETPLHMAVLVHNDNRKLLNCDDVTETRKILKAVADHRNVDKHIRDKNSKTAADYDDCHIIQPAQRQTDPETYVVDKNEYQQFLLWKSSRAKPQHPDIQRTLSCTEIKNLTTGL